MYKPDNYDNVSPKTFIEVKISKKTADHINSFGDFGFWDQEDYQVTEGDLITFIVENERDEDPVFYSPKMIDMAEYCSQELERDLMEALWLYLEEEA